MKRSAFSFILKTCFNSLAGDNTLVTQTAHRGGSVTIDCKYPRAEESSIRRFCREDGNLNCINVISTYIAPQTKTHRYSLTDDKNAGVYTVIISALTEEDAGRYRCAMERFNDSSTACLTEIQLDILSEY